jgi:hypothetical protein
VSARLATAVLLWSPAAARACPVCFAADERVAWFYGVSTTMLSLLPFVVVAAVVGVAVLLNRDA